MVWINQKEKWVIFSERDESITLTLFWGWLEYSKTFQIPYYLRPLKIELLYFSPFFNIMNLFSENNNFSTIKCDSFCIHNTLVIFSFLFCSCFISCAFKIYSHSKFIFWRDVANINIVNQQEAGNYTYFLDAWGIHFYNYENSQIK